jgi:hypothetical protein
MSIKLPCKGITDIKIENSTSNNFKGELLCFTELPERVIRGHFLLGITILNLSANLLREIEELPPLIEKFICNNNYLEKLPKLPENLKMLNCAENRLIELPNLPNFLRKLYCSRNRLLSLPSKLPGHLEVLYCMNNDLTEINLPRKIIDLNCSGNSINNIVFPQSLIYLNIAANKIENLGVSPLSKLVYLECSRNKIKNLDLPPSLLRLFCFGNKLRKLYNLPRGLCTLKCHGNPKLRFIEPLLSLVPCAYYERQYTYPLEIHSLAKFHSEKSYRKYYFFFESKFSLLTLLHKESLDFRTLKFLSKQIDFIFVG